MMRYTTPKFKSLFKSRSNKSSNSENDRQQQLQQQSPVKQDYFDNCHRTYSCIHCRAHLANHDELVSKLFQGNHGRAFLFNKVVNIGCKLAVQRELLTGLHAVADIYCDNCETTLGWKYEQAFVPSQKYKEGKYIIELVHMLKENHWDPTSYNASRLIEQAELSERSSKLIKDDKFLLNIGINNINHNNRLDYESNSNSANDDITKTESFQMIEQENNEEIRESRNIETALRNDTSRRSSSSVNKTLESSDHLEPNQQNQAHNNGNQQSQY